MIIEQVEGTLNMAYNLDGNVLHIDDHDDDFIVDFLKGLNEVIDDNSGIAEILSAAVPLRLGGGDRSDEFSREMRDVISRVKSVLDNPRVDLFMGLPDTSCVAHDNKIDDTDMPSGQKLPSPV
jgi:hypothetical protein